MTYSEVELTEATKFIGYLRSLQRYAVALSLLSIGYFGYRWCARPDGHELYLLSVFIGFVMLGSIAVIIRIDRNTRILYGLSCIVASGAFLLALFYYGHSNPDIITISGVVLGLLTIRHGVTVVFGRQAQEIFSPKSQKKTSFVRNLIKSLKQSHPNDKNVIHCRYTSDEKSKSMKIQFLEDVACFLLEGQHSPMFFDRQNISLFELRDNGELLRVSIVAESHDWLEADIRAEDFKKFQAWKDL